MAERSPPDASSPRRFLGRGWAFPVRIGPHGGFVMVDGQRDVQEAIEIILRTRIGERVMQARFGSEVPGLLFEPNTPATAARIASTIRSSLGEWEPRIDVLDVVVEPDDDVPTRLTASLTYRLRENNAVLNLVFPFYLAEGAEGA